MLSTTLPAVGLALEEMSKISWSGSG